MATPDRVKNKMKELGLSGVNKPKRTPSHKTKSHVVMAKEGDQHKLIRFGQQGVKGAGKNPTDRKRQSPKEIVLCSS
jgi:tRNA(Ile2) C34 agmatinyltransferase TiaS